MNITARFSVRPEYGFKPRRVVLNLINSIPPGHHTVECQILFAHGMNSHKQIIVGPSSFVLELNEVPTVITVRMDGLVANRIQQRDILRISGRTGLRMLTDKLLDEHKTLIQYRYEQPNRRLQEVP